MTTFRVKAWIYPVRRRGLEQEVELVVSTRTIMSVIPRTVAETAGVQVQEHRFFFGRDGTRKRRSIGLLEIAVAGKSAVSSVILGEPGDKPVLGTSTVDDLGLEADFRIGQLRERLGALVLREHAPGSGVTAPS